MAPKPKESETLDKFSSVSADALKTLLTEKRTFKPPKSFVKQALVKTAAVYAKAKKDPVKFWASFAKELAWFKPWKKAMVWDEPHVKWFDGGKINVSYNCLDRHLGTPTQNKAAIIFEGEDGTDKVLTYRDLWREVNRFSHVLKKLGVNKGDRVAIYLPMIPEAAITMLACTRIGAPHSIVFGGFAPESLRDRINDCEAKILITADGGYRRGGIVQLKKNSDIAAAQCPTIQNVVVVQRMGAKMECPMQVGRDLWYHELMAQAPATPFPCEQMDSEDMLFLLYTSGTTGKPKGIVHTTGGYLTGVYATTKWIFDIKDTDVYWCTADIGWVTGHSYIVYGPLANGATTVIYEGSPDWPDKDRFWAIIEKYGVTILYTAPTAIRTFMKWGVEYPQKHDMSSLRLLGSVGEPINPEAWMWYYEHIGGKRCPIVDTWWQTETGHILIAPLPGVVTLKPASATFPFPGIDAEVVDENGKVVPLGGGGYLVIKKPWPGMVRTIYKDDARYASQYWGRMKNVYTTGDGAKRDKEGYYWLLGRIDDVVNVSGHRISTMEVESALVDHPKVAEAAVVGKAHDVKGQALSAFVTVKNSVTVTPELKKELMDHVVKKIGPIARPDDIFFTADLPKTRSGKIMRRLLRDIAEGRALGDTTTLADPNVVAKLKEGYKED